MQPRLFLFNSVGPSPGLPLGAYARRKPRVPSDEQLVAWTKDGTFDRLLSAKAHGDVVHVPRSDGTISDGTIVEVGHGIIFLKIKGTEFVKWIGFDRFLSLNPLYTPPISDTNLARECAVDEGDPGSSNVGA